ncbi:GerW family sporulation protein [Kineothrix sedimenti]|uniref:GerW family sporulation protein n=1 Tax=Kineothrix sedimenti TaxID=3123317 RepID=A0ABZ3F195_9FIRM
MADNNFSGVIESLMKGIDSVLSTKTVVGEATQVGDTIILPLVDVTFGVGAGASSKDNKNGGAGGFTGKMTPSAVLVIKNGTTKLVNIKNQDTVTKILDMIPDIVDKFTSSSDKEEMIADDTAVDIAFPEGTE